MALPPIPPGSPDDGSAVLEIYEPWKVRTGDHVVHTRKVNLGDSYMLGAFILVDDVHLGKVGSGMPTYITRHPPKRPAVAPLIHGDIHTQQLERRRPALPPKSPTPSGLEPGFFTQAFEALPIPVLVSVRGGGPLVLKNAAYQQAFAGDEEAVDAFFRG